MELTQEGQFCSFVDSLPHKLNIVKVIGSGLSGQVVLAQTSTPPVTLHAVKIISLGDGIADLKKRYFHAEIKAMRKFNHGHLMKVNYTFESTVYLYICMPYYPLGSLDKHVPVISYALAELFLVQLASAVKHMHDRRYAHTDIKTANVLLQTPVSVCLTDFGICRELSRCIHEIPSKNFGGTVGYMPPEQLSGDGETRINPKKMDMYSLGVVLKEMIHRPTADASSRAAKYQKEDVPDILKFCLINLLEEDFRERLSSTQLVETLKDKSQWRCRAQGLELAYNSA